MLDTSSKIARKHPSMTQSDPRVTHYLHEHRSEAL
jgi:hypothetical protein